MRFLRRSLVGLFLLAVTLGLLATAVWQVGATIQARMSEEPRSFPAREQILSVNVVPYAPGEVAPVLTVFGELRSRRTLDVRAAAGGTVIETSEDFIDGGEVSAGELLFRVDPSDAEAALARAETDLLDAEAQLRDAERTVALARDELASAEEQVALRQSALTRAQDLLDRGVGTSAAVETAELSYSSARQAVLSRRSALAQAETRLDQARTGVARAQINVAEAERTLTRTEVRAEFSGVLSGVSVGLGGRVTANEVVASILDPEALEAEFRVSTAQYANLIGAGRDPRGAAVAVSLDVGGGIEIVTPGTVIRESATVGDGLTGRVLYASLEQSAGFRPGDFVTVRVQEGPLPDVAVVPASAYGGDGGVLVVGEEFRLRFVAAERLRTQGDDVLIRAEIEPGDLVVAERSPLLGSGIRIQAILPGGEILGAPERGGPPGAGGPPPGAGGGAAEATTAGADNDGLEEMIRLDPDRRAALIAAVEENPGMPAEAKSRMISTLEQDEVPATMVARIESRMGG